MWKSLVFYYGNLGMVQRKRVVHVCKYVTKCQVHVCEIGKQVIHRPDQHTSANLCPKLIHSFSMRASNPLMVR